MSDTYYDIAIVGGGMVGACLAASLAQSSLRILVLETGKPSAASASGDYDLRVSAITRVSERIFRSLGAWDAMTALRVAPFREMHVWDAGGTGEVHFDSAEMGEDCLGHIIENRVISSALQQRLSAYPNLDVRYTCGLEHFEKIDDHFVLQLDHGDPVRCGLLVGADGGHSRVRNLAGIAVHGWAYDQVAVVATLRTELPHRETAWQRFLPTGPLAFLPLQEPYCSIVWSTTPEKAAELMSLDDTEFARQAAEAFEYRLGKVTVCGGRASFPLKLQYADHYVQDGIALIGDAAHSIHPLAGQGVNLGILDAASLAQVLLQAHQQGKRIAALPVLRKYERWRKGDNLGMMMLMDGFKRVFGVRFTPFRILRNAGLRLTDVLPPVKSLIMKNAMGVRGELPDLARPVPLE